MSVDPAITQQIIQEEVAKMASLATSYNWQVTSNISEMTVTVRMKSQLSSQEFIVEARCDNYKVMPPYFEFIHPTTGERGTKLCYPSQQGNSYFHPNPCICVQWNRKAYKSEGGPHNDWQMANWMSYRPSTQTLGDMFQTIQFEIDQCSGRMV